nr:molybdenum cofactor guanylyltransferase MobA [Gammaproteobacteria bacterium]
VFLLVRRSLQPSVAQFLADGERKIVLWFERHRTVTVDFSDQPQMFLNVNRDAERVEVEAKLVARAGHV